MKSTIQRRSRLTKVPRTIGGIRRSRATAVFLAFTLGLGLPALPTAAANDGPMMQRFPVGHGLQRLTVTGSALGEPRTVDVHLWYPADPQGYEQHQKTTYASKLRGAVLTQGLKPLSWAVTSDVARDNAPIVPGGPAFPVIVFSHGNQNDPIDYAPTLELIASRGFVVAAPYHVNNTQDDARIDFINAHLADGSKLSCYDGRPSPCSRPDIAFSMADRVSDISAVLDALPGWFGSRVDVSRAGVLGHSRGTVSALAAAGGSIAWQPSSPTLTCQAPPPPPAPPPNLCWPVAPLNTIAADGTVVSRVKAIMGLAIAKPNVTNGVDLANVKVPTLLVAGGKDQTSPEDISEAAIAQIPAPYKALITIPNAVHRSFDSNYCAEAQAAGATADTNGNGRIDLTGPESELPPWKAQSLLDRQTLAGLVAPTGNSSTSGTAMDYCSSSTFTTPVDIGPAVDDVAGDIALTCRSGNVADPSHPCRQYDGVPATGLDTEQVKQVTAQLAEAFFGAVLKR